MCLTSDQTLLSDALVDVPGDVWDTSARLLTATIIADRNSGNRNTFSVDELLRRAVNNDMNTSEVGVSGRVMNIVLQILNLLLR